MRRIRLVVPAVLAVLAVACGESVTGVAAGSRPQLRRLQGAELAQLQLLQCPMPAPVVAAEGEIDFWGGTVATHGARLLVPVAAVTDETDVTIEAVESPYVEIEVHAVGHESFEFKRLVTVTIDYSRCAPEAVPDPYALRVVYIDAASKQVLEDMGGDVDPVARTITFQTGHFSSYAVAD